MVGVESAEGLLFTMKAVGGYWFWIWNGFQKEGLFLERSMWPLSSSIRYLPHHPPRAGGVKGRNIRNLLVFADDILEPVSCVTKKGAVTRGRERPRRSY